MSIYLQRYLSGLPLPLVLLRCLYLLRSHPAIPVSGSNSKISTSHISSPSHVPCAFLPKVSGSHDLNKINGEITHETNHLPIRHPLQILRSCA